jgi:hypothetical protein
MGTNNSAANSAAAADAQRQAGIQQSIGQIQKAYGSPARQAQYDAYGANLSKYYTGQVNEQEGVNARNLKFAMARNGLSGGSAAVDSNTQLQKDYTKGLLQASQAAQGGVAALKNADMSSQNQLTSLAAQGAYTGAIPQQAGQAMDASLQNAGNYTNANALGNLFGGTAQIYQNNQTAAANRRAQINPIGSLYGSKAWG